MAEILEKAHLPQKTPMSGAGGRGELISESTSKQMSKFLSVASAISALCAARFYLSLDSRQLSTPQEWMLVLTYSIICGLTCAFVLAKSSSGLFAFLEMGLIPSMLEIISISWMILVFFGCVATAWPFFLFAWPLFFFAPQAGALLWMSS